jgi:subtilisin family serine protease
VITQRILVSFCAVAIAATSFGAEQRARYLVATRGVPRAARPALLDERFESRERGVRNFDFVDAFAADLTDAEAMQLRRAAGVRSVQRVVPRQLADAVVPPPFVAAPQDGPMDVEQSVPWGIAVVHAPDVWTQTRGRGTVNVAIFDTGLDKTHPDLAANVAGGYNVLAKSDDFADDNGHGTHVAGTIAALDNGLGVVGVAPEARVWAVKVLDKDGNGTDETVVAGVDKLLEWKHARGGQWIVSLSLGAADPSDAEKAAFDKLADEGVLAVAAAGNRGLPSLDYPGAYTSVLSVGAIGSDNLLAGFSSYGAGLGVVAPGVRVLSTAPRGSTVISGARVDGQDWMLGFPFGGSPHDELRGNVVFCALGKVGQFPPEARGRIAVMQRGDITFAEKVRNAVDAGAVGAVIYNYDDSDPRSDWTLIRSDCTNVQAGCVPWPDDVTYPWPPTISLSKSDGQKLAAQNGGTVTIGTWTTEYRTLNGTSMATPHVSGLAALLWALAPAARATDIRNAILASAHDLGPSGYDIQYGNGLIDAAAAVKLIAPSSPISSPAPTPPPIPAPQPPKRRAVH